MQHKTSLTATQSNRFFEANKPITNIDLALNCLTLSMVLWLPFATCCVEQFSDNKISVEQYNDFIQSYSALPTSQYSAFDKRLFEIYTVNTLGIAILLPFLFILLQIEYDKKSALLNHTLKIILLLVAAQQAETVGNYLLNNSSPSFYFLPIESELSKFLKNVGPILATLTLVTLIKRALSKTYQNETENSNTDVVIKQNNGM